MSRSLKSGWSLALVALCALAAVPAASAYEPPANPGKLAKPTKKIKTLTVSKSCAPAAVTAKTCFSKIQSAVEAAKQTTHKNEYTIKVSPGTYAEFVLIEGHQFDGLTIQGTTTKASDVKIDLSTLSGTALTTGPYTGTTPNRNAITVNATSGVSIKNLTVTHYASNGLWFVNVGVPIAYIQSMDNDPGNVMSPSAPLAKNELFGGKAYTVDNVVASFGGSYGIFARTSLGGSITNSEAYYNDDSGFYIGETPPQTKPVRTAITNVKSWANELGYSGTSSRYVTISKSRWFNNGMGIVPNITMSEHWPPPAENVYTNNDIYSNNFNYFNGAPFPINLGGLGGGAQYPPGIGMLLFSSQKSEVSNNRFWGNKLSGVSILDSAILVKDSSNWKKLCPVGQNPALDSTDCKALKEATKPKWNKVFGNVFGVPKDAAGATVGSNRNGRDITYANDGVGNCVGGTGRNANTFGGTQTQLVELGRHADPTKGWQSCDSSKYKSTFAGSLTVTYFETLTFADATAASGMAGLGLHDPTGVDFVDNTGHQGRWYVWAGTTGTWPTGFGSALETCHITSPYLGCDGQKDGKPAS